MKVQPLANDYVTVFRSPDPASVYTYSPGICRCPNGRLIATLDLGGKGVEKLPGPHSVTGDYGFHNQGKVFTSDDHGKTWTWRADFPFWHARPFVAGDSIYVLGQDGDLSVIRSDDNGTTWSKTFKLTEGQIWHQAPCNVVYANGNVYLVMERRCYFDQKYWPVNTYAPILMRGRLGDDLTKRANWTFATEWAYRDAIPVDQLEWFGVPFYESRREHHFVSPGRRMDALGWLETNVVQFVDPRHIWYDPTGHTFHLWARAHTGSTGYAAILKVVEKADGAMETMFQHAPSGRKMVFVPCPGGQMKMHMLYDEPTRLFWLLSTQATDSMIKPEALPADRFWMPNNERQRLQLHFSTNCVDWCFAGIVTVGATQGQARHYASMVIDGDDLHVLSRSGDEQAHTAHDTNIITFHTIKSFRGLVYL